ncbi:MAG TPA: glycoside hydrolase [Chthonomonas sp.]|jgi:O-glycosyl hydrolase|uniref:glycoside hydrolase n=1 Tax=Chthonomonas sp. TaxID=2282153 RepID=UPI002B4B09D2|nr:glycoside hydrolase [Chthonomonas sp.]HLH81083.1 glycoside hydrolase [Chthonomonas sp.]
MQTTTSLGRILVLDPTMRYQTIDHFGASDCWWAAHIGAEWSHANKERLADLLFSIEKGIGLSCWRFNLTGGYNHVTIHDPWRTGDTFEVRPGIYDWQRLPGQRWFLRAAKARGVPKFLAFVNSPPARMTRNGLTNCTDGLGTTNLLPSMTKAFARYLGDILHHFLSNPVEDERIVFNYISPVNEPQWEWNRGCNQEGNRASNEDIKAITMALYQELQRQKLPTQIALVESGNFQSLTHYVDWMEAKYKARYGNYLEELLGDPTIQPLLGPHLGAHGYGSDHPNGYLLSVCGQVSKAFASYPGWAFWQTEYCVMEWKRDLSMETALRVARVIHADLAYANAAAWNWWTAVSHYDYKDGLIYTDYQKTGDTETIYPSKTLWVLGNYSRFLRPGWRRVHIEGDDGLEGVLASAYVSPEVDRVAVVLTNTTDRAVPVAVQAKNAHLGALTPHVTSATDDLKSYSPLTSTKPYILASRSVTTLTGMLEH